jgi:arginine-tRNA-protein transferase
MAYKTRYRPLEVLGPNGWRLLTEEDVVAAPAREPALTPA